MSIKFGTGRTPASMFHNEEATRATPTGGDLDLKVVGKFNEFMHAVTEPAPLAGMAIAGPAFSLVRNPVMSLLLSKPAGLFSRGLGLRMVSGAAGLPAEVLAFSAAQRAVQHVLQPGSLDWSPEALAQEAGGLGLTLALFKMHGRIAQILLPKGAPQWRSAAAGAGMYSGIVHSHLWEEKLGWREASTWDALLTHSFETFLQLKGMGHLTQRMMGRRYGAWVASLEARAEQEIQKSEGRGFQGTGLLGLANIFQPQVISPEGLLHSVPRDHLLNMSRPPEEGGPPGTHKDPVASAKSEPPRSDPEVLEPDRIRASLLSSIDLFEKSRQDSVRKKAAQGIIAHEQLVTEILFEKFQAMGVSAKAIPEQVEEFLCGVRRLHFELLNHRNFQIAERLSFLVGELRRAKRKARGEDKALLGTLLDSAELRQWEVARVYGEGQAILANSVGYKKNTEFSAKDYPDHRRHFEDFYNRVQHYLLRHPQFKVILESYGEKGMAKWPEPLNAEALHPMIAKLDIAPEKRDLFRDALEFDPFLQEDGFVRLHRVLSLLEKGPEPQVYLEHLQPLNEYLAALKGVKLWLSRSDFSEILLDDYINASVDNAAALKPLRERLLKKIYRRWEQSEGATNLMEAEHALELYLEKIPGLISLLRPFRPDDLYVLPPLKWEEVKGQLRNRVRQGMVHPMAADQILQWIEGTKDHPPDVILSQYRSEFLAGVLEFFFNESRNIRETEEFSYLLVEICNRKDLAMMRSLAVRFHNYHRGMETRSRYLAKPEKPGNGASENGNDRHETLRQALLETAKIYQSYPDFRGPLFEILEKIKDRSQPHSARLNAPIHLGIQSLLLTGRAVELLAHPSLGVELVRVGGEGEGSRLVLISSIQENLEKKSSFNRWMKKLAKEVEPAYQEPYEVILYVPRIHSDGIRKEVLTWARDFLEEHPELNQIQIFLPAPSRGKAVADPMDPIQYVPYYIDRTALTTEQRIGILKTEVAGGSRDAETYLALYQLSRRSQFLVDLESDAFHYLLEARRFFPENKTVAGEMWRVLHENFRYLSYFGHNQLSDFDATDGVRNREHLKLLDLMARDPVQYSLHQVGREFDQFEARMRSTPASQRDSEVREVKDLFFRAVDVALNARAADVLPREGILKTLDERDLSLGSADHYRRVGLFMEAILGQPFPNLNLKEVFDLSSLGYETRHWQFAYDLKRPHRFTLRAEIVPKEGAQSAYRRRGGLEELKRDPASGYDEGQLILRVEGISNRGETRLVVKKMKMPESHHGNGVGTLLTQKLVTLGQTLGARYLVFREAENSGKYALFKMGGRVPDKELWKSIRSSFAQFVDRQIQDHNLWGFDTSAVASLRNGQELANAYLDPLVRKLTVQSRWGEREGMSDLFWVDPGVESQFHVGREFFMQKIFLDWDIMFDLRTDSPSMKTFWKYYQYRFNLADGEILHEAPGTKGTQDPSP